MNKESEIERGIRELFRYAFITNCHLDESEVTKREIDAVESLDSVDILEGFKELIIALLKFKKDSKSERKDNVLIQYELLLQKLETELRDHLRTEQQLKITIESLKQKLSESEKNCIVANLKIKDSEETLKTENVTDYNLKSQKKYSSLNTQLQEFKKIQIEKMAEIRNMQKVSSKNYETEKRHEQPIDFIKKKLEEKSKEIAKIQDKIREKINSRPPMSTSPIPSRKALILNENSNRLNNIQEKRENLIKSHHIRSVSVQSIKKT